MIINKIAVFVEGQGELIFFRKMILHLLSDINIPFSFECLKLNSGDFCDVPYKQNNPEAIVHFMIINVGNDERVLTVIKEREENLLQNGYSKIIGLRDMYSKAYRKKSLGIINENVNNQFIKSVESIIQLMSDPEKVSFYFSIMEIEAWWLSMYSIFVKINELLTVDYINENLGFRLDILDPEKEFFHPATVLTQVLNLIEIPYKKKLHDVELIINCIDIIDIKKVLTSGKCNSFKLFIDEILNSLKI